MDMQEKVGAIIALLKQAYPGAVCSLDYGKDYELMISVRLSAQCTDERVNLVTPALFARYPTLEALAEADVADVEALVHSCGFYKHKAQDIVSACQQLLTRFGGRVPDNMEDLLSLPGVGRKTANLLLGDIYKVPGSVVCDTHCIRICNKLGLAHGKEPEKGGDAASRDPPAGGVLGFLPSPCAARTGRLHRAQSSLRALHAGPVLRQLFRGSGRPRRRDKASHFWR
jgi:endonuclease-3